MGEMKAACHTAHFSWNSTNKSFFFPFCRCGIPADICVPLNGPEPVPWVPGRGKGSPRPTPPPISLTAPDTLVE